MLAKEKKDRIDIDDNVFDFTDNVKYLIHLSIFFEHILGSLEHLLHILLPAWAVSGSLPTNAYSQPLTTLREEYILGV